MSEGESELSKGADPSPYGLILGCWDHEKTPALIQDLENSVTLVEKKCIKLFEELIHYKKYLEESGGVDFSSAVFKKKTRKSKNSHCFSGSDPDISFRKSLINSNELQQVFEEKFKSKLGNINEELKAAARKMGLKDNILLFPSDDYFRVHNARTEHQAESSWCDSREKFIKANLFNAKTKSDPIIIESSEKAEFSQITQNELELYQKLSRLSMNRSRKGRKPKGKKLAFCSKRKTPRFRQDGFASKADAKKKKSRKKKLKKRAMDLRETTSQSPVESSSTKFSEENVNDSEIEKLCNSLSEALDKKKAMKPGIEAKGDESAAERNITLEAAIRKSVPFTACASTSRSYNIGLNMQQLLSQSKHRKKPVSGNSRVQPSAGPQKFECAGDPASQNAAADAEKGNAASWSPSNWKNCVFEDDEDGKRKVWVTEHSKSFNLRKVRSKYTGSSPEGFLEYHKSTTSQCAGGRKSMIQSESKTAYAVGSRIMVSDCQRTHVFEIARENACGDNTANDPCGRLNSEWTKAYTSFLNMRRKYTTLKEKLAGKDSVVAYADLKALENEIDCSIEKYKDFLQFYSKFLQLNQHLKLIKTAGQSKGLEPAQSFSSNCNGKSCGYRSTDSNILRKALREIQDLQDKIRLVNV